MYDDEMKKPKKIIRIILKKPNGHETMDDQFIDTKTEPKDIDKLLMEKISGKLPDLQDSKDTKIIAQIIDLKPGEEETIEEFQTDLVAAGKDLKNILEKTPRTKTSKKKDSLGKIITKIFRRKPDGNEEIVEEHSEDPNETGRDIGDDTLGMFKFFFIIWLFPLFFKLCFPLIFSIWLFPLFYDLSFFPYFFNLAFPFIFSIWLFPLFFNYAFPLFFFY